MGGRGRKSAATIAADKARLAALMAARKEVERAGGSWDPVRGCAREVSGLPTLEEEEGIECLGESTRAEAEAARDVAGQAVAVTVEEEAPAGMLQETLAELDEEAMTLGELLAAHMATMV
jgi:hypothetical protein